ncbi:DUF5133 domain-containing protein [Streptomyces sp. NPDC001980]|uniref:DUF5133 domain-containing protein n=1 Tax=Streptomyces sp. NPDC001980 TaxID=3157126 RepID=UPI00331888B8
MNRLLQGAAAVPAAALAWSPAADMPEIDDAYVLEAELPGIRRDDIEMSERELRISAEYKEREREGVLRRTTRRAGRFEYRPCCPSCQGGGGQCDPARGATACCCPTSGPLPLRFARNGLLRDPLSSLSYRRLDDAAYTLCVLMGLRNAADAVARAESLLVRASTEHGRRRGGHARTGIR